MLKMSTRVILLLYRNGEEWQRIRQAVAPKVMRPKVLEENIDDFNCVAEDTIQRWKKIKVTSGQDGEVPELEGELKKWSTESRYTGLQATVSHQALTNQNLFMSNKIPTVVEHNVQTIFFISNHFTVRMEYCKSTMSKSYFFINARP